MPKKKALFYITVEYIFAILLGIYVFTYNVGSVNLFIALLYADVIMTVVIFVFSIIHDNSSIYDPYWSIIPPVLFLLWMEAMENYLVITWVILIGILVWSIRLTTNWARDYKGIEHEDFRYVEFRNKFKQYYWMISFLGIHLFPTLIVILSMYPLYYAIEQEVVLSIFVYIGVAIMVIAAVISFIADEQVRKHKSNPQNKKKALGKGLWKLSRHPNYFGEVLFWFGAVVISFGYGFHVMNYVGFIGMLLLFNLYSVPKMEQKELRSKDNYQDIIDTVPRFFPIKFK